MLINEAFEIIVIMRFASSKDCRPCFILWKALSALAYLVHVRLLFWGKSPSLVVLLAIYSTIYMLVDYSPSEFFLCFFQTIFAMLKRLAKAWIQKEEKIY